ncbi:MAG: radical SAM protein [Clostridia bacterium]|jgi:MoaA/NifB/PqqE/SkfB family radical SAM enzyme|nr:radical SAM protein [Clostridia bacterium]
MSTVKTRMADVLVKEIISYINKDPMANIATILNIAEKLVKNEEHKKILGGFREIAGDPKSNWYGLMERVFSQVNPKCQQSFVRNFFFQSAVLATPVKSKLKEKYGCNIPWAILMDPTPACNLKCTGCWAAEYDKDSGLTFDELDEIIRQGKELGIYMYIYSGGEPTLRKKDLLNLAEKHRDCMFLAFTNATLIDEFYARDLARVGNFALAISVDGFEEETDRRRGKGTFRKVMKAMDILREVGVGFGFSATYHKYNTQIVGSDEFVDFLINKGCLFGWYFTYMPIGKHAVVDMMVTAGQREYMYHRVRKMRAEKPCFLLDFWNDGEYVNGCIAGGRSYLHINANGDVEPCAFIHFSDTNIKEKTLLEALQSPLFQQYRKNHPFNNNHLRPCPCLDNPDKLKEMVEASGASSTQADGEDVVELTNKCRKAAEEWAATAEGLWKKAHVH